ncbi:hypothetical protein GCM10009765_40790 [Fodinicola feengrottensis]|uniref:YtxH domain-containing protein n=1 Tax=Fodinicola feengrottensis TaxID=435914 RepID=A0ABN2HGE0_9ACTN
METRLLGVIGAILVLGCGGMLYVAYRCDQALNQLEAAEKRISDLTAWADELKDGWDR